MDGVVGAPFAAIVGVEVEDNDVVEEAAAAAAAAETELEADDEAAD